MKNLKFLFLFCLTLALITSCSKEDDPGDNLNKLDAPTLITPANNTSYNDLPNFFVFLDWADVSNATEYQVEISSSSDFSSIVSSNATSNSEYDAGTGLFSLNTTYYWRVRALAPGFDNSDFSQVFSFSFGAGPAACAICGQYNGGLSGNMQIPLTATDTSFTNVNTSAVVTELSGSNNTHNIALDISALLGAPSGTLVPNFDGSYSGGTLTVSNQSYVYQGIATIMINGSMTFPTANTTSGTFTLSNDAMGTVSFSGTK